MQKENVAKLIDMPAQKLRGFFPWVQTLVLKTQVDHLHENGENSDYYFLGIEENEAYLSSIDDVDNLSIVLQLTQRNNKSYFVHFDAFPSLTPMIIGTKRSKRTVHGTYIMPQH